MATVRQWLQSINLEQYLSQFNERGITTILQCSLLQESDLVDVGISLSGHRRRILTHLPNVDDEIYQNIDSCMNSSAGQSNTGNDDIYENTPASSASELPPELPKKTKPRNSEWLPTPSLDVSATSPKFDSGKRPVPKPRKASKRVSDACETVLKLSELSTVSEKEFESKTESCQGEVHKSENGIGDTIAKSAELDRESKENCEAPIVITSPPQLPALPDVKPKPKPRPQPSPRRKESSSPIGSGSDSDKVTRVESYPNISSESTRNSFQSGSPVDALKSNNSGMKATSCDSLFSDLQKEFVVDGGARPASLDSLIMKLDTKPSSDVPTKELDIGEVASFGSNIPRDRVSDVPAVKPHPVLQPKTTLTKSEETVGAAKTKWRDSTSSNSSIDSISKLYSKVDKHRKSNGRDSAGPAAITQQVDDSNQLDVSSPEGESPYEAIWIAKRASGGKPDGPYNLAPSLGPNETSTSDSLSDFARKSAIDESTTDPFRMSLTPLDPFETKLANVSMHNTDLSSLHLDPFDNSSDVKMGNLNLDQFDPFNMKSTNSGPSSDLMRFESIEMPTSGDICWSNTSSSRDSTLSFNLPPPNFSPPPLPDTSDIPMPDFSPPAVPMPDFPPPAVPMPDFPPPAVPISPSCPTAPPPPVPARSSDSDKRLSEVTTPRDILSDQPLLDQDPFGDFWAQSNIVPTPNFDDDADNYDVPPVMSSARSSFEMRQMANQEYDVPTPSSSGRSSSEIKEVSPFAANNSPPQDPSDFTRLSEVVPPMDPFSIPSSMYQDPWGVAGVREEDTVERQTPTRRAPPPPLPTREGNPFESFKDRHTGMYVLGGDLEYGSSEQLDTSCGASEGSLSDGGEFLYSEAEFSPSLINMGCVDVEDISSRIPVIPQAPKSMERSGYLLKHGGVREHARLLKKKWVTFSKDCLRYYKDNKRRISDRMIPVSTMKNVENDIRAKEFRFKLTTVDRVYIFSSDDRDGILQWTSTLMQAILNYKPPPGGFKTGGVMCNADQEGFIRIGNEKGKRYFVAKSDKVCYYNNYDDYKVASPIHEIEMYLASVKELFGKNKLQLSTPYKQYILSFDTGHELSQWKMAFEEAITVGLSDDKVMRQIYANVSNTTCADCGEVKPDWAATHLIIVICKRCAGIHRELWPFKVKSLRMDLKVWNSALIELYLSYGNQAANSLWEWSLNIQDKIQPDSNMVNRKEFIINKYCNKDYFKRHVLTGEDLNEALCRAVQFPDVMETMESLFSGADILCTSQVEANLTPLQLAERVGQTLHVEFLNQNGANTSTQQPSASNYKSISSLSKGAGVSKKGWMHKTGSNRREFLRRWCTLDHKVLSYYLDDKSNTAKDSILSKEMIGITLTSNERFRHCFELCTFKESGRSYLFALEGEDDRTAWTIAIAKSFCPDGASDYIKKTFDRAGYVYLKEGSTAEWAKSWLQLHVDTRTVYIFDEVKKEFEEIDLRKVTSIKTVDSVQRSPAVESGLVFVVALPGRWLYIQGEFQKETSDWLSHLNTVAKTTSQSLGDQQLTSENTPVIVDQCINFIYTHGMTVEGIYRRNGTHTKISSLLEQFNQDARSVLIKTDDYEVHDIANVLKRYFRTLSDPLLTKDLYPKWLETAGMVDHTVKMQWYKHLVDQLPPVNRATLKKLILHLKSVSDQSAENMMTVVNLASIFGPALMTLDHDQEATKMSGFDTTKYEITTIVDMLQYHAWLFEVEDAEIAKEKKIQEALEKMKSAQTQKVQAGEFIMGIYMNNKAGRCLNIKVPAHMSAEELVLQISSTEEFNPNRYAVYEVICQGELERPLNDNEKVLDVTLNWSSWDEEFRKDNYLCVKHNYVQLKVDTVISPHLSSFSELKFSNKKGFKKFFFQFSQSKLSYFKDSKLENPEASWNAEDIVLFMGTERKRAPPKDHPYAFTFILRKEHVIKNRDSPFFGHTVCCATEEELYRWVAAILTAQRSARLSCLSSASGFDYSFKESSAASSGLSKNKPSMFKKTFNKLSFRR